MKSSLTVKNGIWYGIIYYKDEFGRNKQKWISTGLKERGNKKQAQKFIEDVIKDFSLEKPVIKETEAPPVQNDIIFMDYMKDYILAKEKELSPNVFESYMSNYGVMEKYFGKELKLKDVRVEHIESFFDYLRNVRGKKNTTVKHHAIIISPALRQAYRDDLIRKNPCEFLAKIKREKPVRKFYDKNEIEQLFNSIKGDPIELVIIIATYYGFRRSEVIGLKWNAIDFESKTITIQHKVLKTRKKIHASDTLKTKSSNRTLPLLPYIEELLLTQKEKIEKNKIIYGKCYNSKYLDYICVNELGDIINPDYVSKHFNQLLKKHNLKHIRFHDLRHTCASLLVSNKIPMKNIQEWLGHANFNTTADVYSHLDFSSKFESASAIDNALTKKQQVIESNNKSIYDDLTDEELDEELEKLLKQKEQRKKNQSSEM